MRVNAIVNVAPWQPSGAPATIVTTSTIDCVADVALAATARLRPVALATDTFDDGQPAGLLEVTAPTVIDANVTGYGFALVTVKKTSPPVNPGYRSAAPVAADTVTI